MKNFKDTVYSIFLGEDVVPPTTPPLRGIGDDSGKGRPTTKEKAPKGYTQEEWDKITDKYDEDMKRIDQEKAQAKTQEIKDATVVTSGGVKRSLTAPEAQQAAKAAGVVSPHGNARPGEGLLTPEERARVNQVQQNPGNTTSRIAFQDKEQIDSNKIFNRSTGQWEQGPPRSKGRARPAGMPSGQHIDGMRDEEGPPPDSRTPEQIKVEDEAMRSRSRELLNDIILKNAKQKEDESTPEGRKKIDDALRAKNNLAPRNQEDFDIIDAGREAANKKALEDEEPAEDEHGNEITDADGKTMTRGQVRDEERKTKNKEKNKEEADRARAKREAAADALRSATFEIGPNGVQRMVRPGSGGSRGSGSGGGYGGSGAGPFGSGSGGNVSSRNSTAQDSFASTATPATSSIVSARTDGRAGQASALATFNASKNKRSSNSRSRPILTTGYSHNKALTFFAEQLKRKYIEEEVVNPENQPMTKSEISHRDKIRHKSPAKDARIVKSADKTQANAAYRLATYITMRGRKGKKKENK